MSSQPHFNDWAIAYFESWRIIFFGLLLSILTSCQDAGLITPPVDPLGNNLNSLQADSNPRFSQDGRFLVFSSDRQQQRKIFLYDVINRKLMPLPGLNQPGIFYDEPDLSRDGKYLVYVSQQEGKSDIFLYDRQTFESQNLTKFLLLEVRHPTISADGRWVAFEANRNGQWDIEIYDRGIVDAVEPP